MNLHKPTFHRRNSAQKRNSEFYCLDSNRICMNVIVVSGVLIPASFADYLFRTPSLSGQAFFIDDCLSAYLSCSAFWPFRLWQERAEKLHLAELNLRKMPDRAWLAASSKNKHEGIITCRNLEKSLDSSQSVAVCRPVAIPWVNKRSTALGPGSSARQRLTRMSMRARRQVLRPTCCTVTRNQARATEYLTRPTPTRTSRRPQTLNNTFSQWTPIRTGAVEIPCFRNTALASCASGGVLRSTLNQMKDTPCSTRS